MKKAYAVCSVHAPNSDLAKWYGNTDRFKRQNNEKNKIPSSSENYR